MNKLLTWLAGFLSQLMDGLVFCTVLAVGLIVLSPGIIIVGFVLMIAFTLITQGMIDFYHCFGMTISVCTGIIIPTLMWVVYRFGPKAPKYDPYYDTHWKGGIQTGSCPFG